MYYRSGSFVGSTSYLYQNKYDPNEDQLGQRIRQIDYSCTTSHRITYTYDDVGNIQTADVGDNYGWTYGYDNIYQVTSADQLSRDPQRNVDFTYDSVYNRTLWTDTLAPAVDVSYQDNALHQYTLVGAVTPTYDNNGNITSFDGAMTMGYDCENRLQTAGAVSYGYDLLGRRISRAVSTGNTMYVYDGPHIIAEYLNGSLARKYIYGPGIDNPVAMVRCLSSVEVWYYYYTDVLGSVRLLTNASGAVVESYTYDPYGQPRVMYNLGSISGPGPDGNWLTEDTTTFNGSFLSRGNPILFTGRWWDSSTNLYYYRFRDYSPTLGRFLQPDPAKYIDGMNLYAYCGNNPINWIDPWGLETNNSDPQQAGGVPPFMLPRPQPTPPQLPGQKPMTPNSQPPKYIPKNPPGVEPPAVPPGNRMPGPGKTPWQVMRNLGLGLLQLIKCFHFGGEGFYMMMAYPPEAINPSPPPRGPQPI